MSPMRTALLALVLTASPAAAQVPEAWRVPDAWPGLDSLRVHPLPDSLLQLWSVPDGAAVRSPVPPGPCDAAVPMPEMPLGAAPPTPMPSPDPSGPPPVPMPNLCGESVAAAAPSARPLPPVYRFGMPSRPGGRALPLRIVPSVPVPDLPVVPHGERE